MRGRIVRLKEGFGFIQDEYNESRFFHRSQLINCVFDDLVIRDSVQFFPFQNEKGLIAEKISLSENFEKCRVIFCPSCRQKIRIPLPLPGKICKCVSCEHKFQMFCDRNGTIYIYGDDNEPHHEEMSFEMCFEILEIAYPASQDQIKQAYKRKIAEYHPDKVALLGKKLIQVAETEARRINAAYKILKTL